MGYTATVTYKCDQCGNVVVTEKPFVEADGSPIKEWFEIGNPSAFAEKTLVCSLQCVKEWALRPVSV